SREEGAPSGGGRPPGEGTGGGVKALLTHEVGSLDKPGWRVKAFAGKPLAEADYEEARHWGERLQVPDYPKLVELLRQSPLSREQKHEIQRWSSRYAVRLLESAGLDVVYDGEQPRRGGAARGAKGRPASLRAGGGAQDHPAQHRGPARSGRGLDPGRRARRLDRARRAEPVRGKLQRHGRGPAGHLLHPPVLQRLP